MGHALVLDGVYAEDPKTGRLQWHRSRRWTTEDVEGLVVRIADRAEAWLARRGYGTGAVDEEVEDDALSLIQSASVAGRSAVTKIGWASGEAGASARGGVLAVIFP